MEGRAHLPALVRTLMTIQYQLPKPADANDFELFCQRVFERICDVPRLQRYGRSGQSQRGVDLTGRRESGELILVQSKVRANGTLRASEVEADIRLGLDSFKDCTEYHFATTAPRDTHLTDLVDRIDKASPVAVAIWFWEDLAEWLDRPTNVDLVAELYASVIALVRSSAGVQTPLQEPRAPGLAVYAPQPSSKLGDTIESAFLRAESGETESAIATLETLRATTWDHSDAHTRYRICANLGHAFYFAGDAQNASNAYIQARAEEKTLDSWTLEALAHQLNGNRSRAEQIADAILVEHPDHAKAYAIWASATSSSYEDTSARIPDQFLRDSEIALALSFKASDQDLYDKALQHARDAIVDAHHWSYPQFHLASLLVREAAKSLVVHVDGTPLIGERERPLLEEASGLLAEATSNPRGLQPTALADCLYLVALIADYQRDPEASRVAMHRAMEVAPSDRRVLIGQAIRLDRDGNHNEAIRVLRRATSIQRDEEIRAEVLLAMLLDERGASGDRSEALSVLHSVSSLIPSLPRWDAISWGLKLLDLADTHQDALGAIASRISPLAANILHLRTLKGTTLSAALADLLQVLRETDTERLSSEEQKILARACLIDERFDDAIEFLQDLVSPHHLTVEAIWYLDALLAMGKDREALDFLESLRKAGDWGHQTLVREINLHCRYGALRAALSLLNKWLKSHPEDLSAQLWYGNLLADAGETTEASAIVSSLPRPEIISLDDFGHAARLVTRCPNMSPNSACDWVYRAWRRFRHAETSWKYFLSSMIAVQIQEGGESASRPVVEEGTGVVLRGKSGKRFVRYVLSLEEPAGEYGEIAVDSQVGNSLLGLRIGDSVDLPGHSGLVVESIALAHSLAFEEARDRMIEQFPDQQIIQRIEGKAQQDAFKASVASQRRLLLQTYDQHQLTVATYAQFSTETPFCLFRRLAKAPGQIVHSYHCAPQGSRPIVVDDTAIATFSLLDNAEALIRDREVLATEMLEVGLNASLTSRSLCGNTSEAESARVKWLLSESARTDGWALADLPVPLRTQLEDATNPDYCQSIAVAYSQQYLFWTDDGPLAAFLNKEAGISCISTSGLVTALLSNEPKRAHSLLSQLHLLSYANTPVTPESLVHSYTSGCLESIEDVLNNPALTSQDALQLAARTLYYGWRLPIMSLDPNELILRILTGLDRRSECLDLDHLLAEIQHAAGLDVVSAAHLKELILAVRQR